MVIVSSIFPALSRCHHNFSYIFPFDEREMEKVPKKNRSHEIGVRSRGKSPCVHLFPRACRGHVAILLLQIEPGVLQLLGGNRNGVGVPRRLPDERAAPSENKSENTATLLRKPAAVVVEPVVLRIVGTGWTDSLERLRHWQDRRTPWPCYLATRDHARVQEATGTSPIYSPIRRQANVFATLPKSNCEAVGIAIE